jgi:hypothetical protein
MIDEVTKARLAIGLPSNRFFDASDNVKCPLSGVKQTCLFAVRMYAFDPKRTCDPTRPKPIALFQVSGENISSTDVKIEINIFANSQLIPQLPLRLTSDAPIHRCGRAVLPHGAHKSEICRSLRSI